MTRNTLFFLLLLMFGGTAVHAQTADTETIQADVRYLASDELEGRATGSNGEALAGDYIASRFESLGLTPHGVDRSWFQPFSFKFHPNPHDTTGIPTSGKNVLGIFDNGADRTVIVGAHYDHLGYGGAGSRAPDETAIHNGADDNASGVAALFEIARQLFESQLAQNVLFLAFSGEEQGLIGSKHFAEEPTVELDRVSFMINLDMVGRLKDDRTLVVGGAGTSPTWIPLLDSLAGNFSVKIDSSGLGPSDHTSFYLKDLPVLHFFTGQHREYHKPSDDSDLINYEGIHAIASLVVDIIEATDGSEQLAFAKTKDKNQGRMAARFKVSMGVMPDYAWDGEGLRIDAVLDDRPASRAGLEDGDIVIRLADMEVTDVYTYMEALSKLDAGDETTVVVRRGEEIIEKAIAF